MKTKIWYTADGRDVQLRQMSAEHIRNCLVLIKRKALHEQRLWRTRYLLPLHMELLRRG